MRQFSLIAGVLVLVVALVLLNKGIGRNAQPDDDDANQQTHSQPQKPAAPPLSAQSAKTSIPPEGTIGNPATAKYKITVGWEYDAANQAKPEALTEALAAVAKFVNAQQGTAAAEIADMDVPAAQRSPAAQAVTNLGIAVNGKPVPGLATNMGEGSATAANIPGALQAATR